MTSVDQAKLFATTDASVWAEEWCRIAISLDLDGRPVIDEGWMIGWFANAIETAKSHERRRIAEQIMGYPITIDVDRLGEGPKA